MKTLEQVDWEVLKGVSRQKIMELATCEFLEAAADVIIAGPVGTGKTHPAISLGVEAARRRFRVAFYRAADLVRVLTEARDERTLTLLHRRLRRADLLILDELGFVPFERAGGELLFELISQRHEIRSTLITTNLYFGDVGRGLRRREAHDRLAGSARALRPRADYPGRFLPDTQANRGGRTDASVDADRATLRRPAGMAQLQNVGPLNFSALRTGGFRPHCARPT